MEQNVCRIAIFYDGSYFSRISNHYLYEHERRARISLRGLHEFIVNEVSRCESIDKRRCQIVDAAYFRGRLSAQQAQDRDRLYADRVFEDVLMREDITIHQQLLSTNFETGDFQEKRIDVWLALEAYEMASLKRYDVCVLVAGDGDFVPLVRKLNTLGSRVMLMGWDIEAVKDGKTIMTRVSTALIERVNYPIMVNSEIDSRERRTDPLIQGLFMPRNAEPLARASNSKKPVGAKGGREGGLERPSGTIANVNTEKGFGFIKPEGGGENLFFHVSDLTDCGLDELSIGDSVTYESVRSERGLCAKEVCPVV